MKKLVAALALLGISSIGACGPGTTTNVNGSGSGNTQQGAGSSSGGTVVTPPASSP